MYVGFFVGWLGLWVVFGRANMTAVVVVAAGILAAALFVLLYEEPTLRGKFGMDYEEYCRNVRRWAPRLHAWKE
jgi:protein-S-isoprenylcysteine O-methyltransferase Ste14